MTQGDVHLRPPGDEDFPILERWMSDPKIYRWFDFGNNRQSLNKTALLGIARNPANVVRVFSTSPGGDAMGVIVIQDARSMFRSGHLWLVRWCFDEGGRDITYHAVIETMRVAFDECQAESINIWIAELNWPSVALCKRVGFKESGRLRSSHVVGSRRCDRLLFDMLRQEFESLHSTALSSHGQPLEQWNA